jgi:hypothetical protein
MLASTKRSISVDIPTQTVAGSTPQSLRIHRERGPALAACSQGHQSTYSAANTSSKSDVHLGMDSLPPYRGKILIPASVIRRFASEILQRCYEVHQRIEFVLAERHCHQSVGQRLEASFTRICLYTATFRSAFGIPLMRVIVPGISTRLVRAE